MNLIKFQVILPVFNASRWFREALQSVAAHSFGEVFVIDDGSRGDERDKIAAICSEFKTVRFISRPHEGLVGALNYGLSIATAPYIARMDADDISLPHRFDRQLEFLDQNSDIAVIGSQMRGIDEAGQLNGLSTQLPITPDAINARLHDGKSPFIHPSVMMRRDALLSVGAYRKATEYSEDYDLWLRLSEKYKLANLDEPLIHYRRHGSQITRSINWRQKMAHDLGTISAERRRSGKPDPLLQITQPISLDENVKISDPEIRTLVQIYRLLLDPRTSENLSPAVFRDAVELLSLPRFGASSKPQSKAAIKLTKLAWQRRLRPIAFALFVKAIQKNPFLVISELLKGL